MACGEVAECSPTVPGLQTLSLFGVAGSDVPALKRLRDELHGLALALGAGCALTRGKMAGRDPCLIVSDVDSTFIRGEAAGMLADAIGSGPRVVAITEAAVNGKLDSAEVPMERVATLEDLSIDRIESIADHIGPVSGVETLVATAHACGYAVGPVSDGSIEVIGGLARRLDIGCMLTNRFETSGSVLTGRTEGEIVTREHKTEAPRRWSEDGRLSGADLPGGPDSLKNSNLPKDPALPLGARGREGADAHSRGFSSPRERVGLSEIVTAGNGASDLSMMEIAGPSIVVRVESAVLAAADAVVTRPRLGILATIPGWDAA